MVLPIARSWRSVQVDSSDGVCLTCYKKMHPYGPKADYYYRITVFDRAQQAGLDDNGLGALFGLYDYMFEVMGLLMHAHYLDRTYGPGPHTISIPRWLLCN